MRSVALCSEEVQKLQQFLGHVQQIMKPALFLPDPPVFVDDSSKLEFLNYVRRLGAMPEVMAALAKDSETRKRLPKELLRLLQTLGSDSVLPLVLLMMTPGAPQPYDVHTAVPMGGTAVPMGGLNGSSATIRLVQEVTEKSARELPDDLRFATNSGPKGVQNWGALLHGAFAPEPLVPPGPPPSFAALPDAPAHPCESVFCFAGEELKAATAGCEKFREELSSAINPGVGKEEHLAEAKNFAEKCLAKAQLLVVEAKLNLDNAVEEMGGDKLRTFLGANLKAGEASPPIANVFIFHALWALILMAHGADSKLVGSLFQVCLEVSSKSGGFEWAFVRSSFSAAGGKYGAPVSVNNLLVSL